MVIFVKLFATSMDNKIYKRKVFYREYAPLTPRSFSQPRLGFEVNNRLPASPVTLEKAKCQRTHLLS